ncbi:MAG: hypothetical protein V7K27_26310 [Nostoc sp.]|uniref:hypothetical protein n=1 Tax=Nostoc sp. TaxID=1180 RepID=UPI002FF91378
MQKRIWESVGKDYEKFGDRVGWPDLNYYDSPQGHLPAFGGYAEECRGAKFKSSIIEFSFLASRLVNCKMERISSPLL